MPSRAERFAWDAFVQKMKQHQPDFDGCVPVALVVLPVCHSHQHGAAEVGEVDVDLDALPALMWPPGFSAEQRAEVLERAARGLRAGTIA